MKILGVETSGAKRVPGTFGWLVQRNAALRDVFAGEPKLQARLRELQRWQSQRLLRSHDDLHRQPRYRLAIEFFFDELYGGTDPRGRDRDLLKVHRAMERLLPAEALNALTLAVDLEILSQELDADVTRALPAAGAITVETYAQAYRATGRRPERERQIVLLGQIGGYLDKVVQKPIVRTLVRLARRPAHAAGFGEMQDFLEHGLEAFEAMHGADEFLETIRSREWRYLERLFASAGNPFEFGDGERSRTGG
jgi:hypothetical protein